VLLAEVLDQFLDLRPGELTPSRYLPFKANKGMGTKYAERLLLQCLLGDTD